jgi:MutS domain V
MNSPQEVGQVIEPPLAVYQRRREVRRQAVARLAAFDSAIGWLRLAVFAAAIAIAVVALRAGTISALWLLAPAAAFLALIVFHDGVIRRREQADRAVRLYEDGIARVEDRPPPGDGRSRRFADEEHAFALDLDLFGEGSLHERLSTARTSMGDETLAAWLKAPALPAVARDRQRAVAEMAPLLDLKEDLSVLGAVLSVNMTPKTLAAWAGGAPLPLPKLPGGLAGARIVTALLAAAITAALVAAFLSRTGAYVLGAAIACGVGWTARLRSLVKAVLFDANQRAGELKLVAALLGRLERASFTAPLLVRLRTALETTAGAAGAARPPSRRIARLAMLVDLLDARRNQMAAILTAPLLWTTQAALAIEAWRRAFGPAVSVWLAAVGEIEALASLSTFAFEHPELPFPELLDTPPPRLEGEGLAHPLLPARTRVANDLVLGGAHPRMLIVSGSNMSGKSTLLRTVGINVVLALAGAPVCARRLVCSRLALGGTLRIHDSLQEGRSRFYAEITRLRQIVDLAEGPVPALFLLDELLSGTNSHDRRVGAEGILRGLLDRGAIGLATTHDLALTEMAAALGAANVHFEDDLRDGQMCFDYRMRPGVVRKSNALALMRAVGLQVTEPRPPTG